MAQRAGRSPGGDASRRSFNGLNASGAAGPIASQMAARAAAEADLGTGNPTTAHGSALQTSFEGTIAGASLMVVGSAGT